MDTLLPNSPRQRGMRNQCDSRLQAHPKRYVGNQRRYDQQVDKDEGFVRCTPSAAKHDPDRHCSCGHLRAPTHIPPAEAEANFYAALERSDLAA